MRSMFSNSTIFLKTFADQGPGESFFAQDLVLRIGEYNCSVFPMNVHSDLLFEFSGWPRPVRKPVTSGMTATAAMTLAKVQKRFSCWSACPGG
jgi:hypothetical protein